MRYWALLLPLLVSLVGYWRYQPQLSSHPQVVIDESVAADFALLIDETWTQFLTVFVARADCFGDVKIVALKRLDDQALYDPKSATLYVRVPARGSRLRSALVHEWAHHLEFQCAAHEELRASFLSAQGFRPSITWHKAAGSVNMRTYQWASIPSEQFAETVVAVVLGEQAVRTPVRITDAGMAVVRAWANKELIQPTSEEHR